MHCSNARTCKHCAKKIVKDGEGYRTDERDLSIDRVRCDKSPETNPFFQRHQPAEMQPVRVIAQGAGLEIWTGDAP